jgi:3-hydroxymyristoyl/3-hydroxydecanoyl-(acyl carrier protein) dehydratase
VEEKRLSLAQLEACINQSEWIDQSYTLLLTNKRDIMAAVLVLSIQGKEFLKRHGKLELVKQLRQHLMSSFETVLLPKKWLCLKVLPLTIQGKVDQPLLKQLLTLERTRYPAIQYLEFQKDQVILQLKAQATLVYFNGHFPDQPILPGVAQLFWVEYFAKLFFDIKGSFLTMEVIKFKKIIAPDSHFIMELQWKQDSGKVYFFLRSSADVFSSGRMVYSVN